jgi:phytoene dehydrogenase-like protein
MAHESRKRRVGIIGAGVSGLRCATVLLEHGCDVTIIEARDRLGGRITQSSAMGPLDVDVGANWVHR